MSFICHAVKGYAWFCKAIIQYNILLCQSFSLITSCPEVLNTTDIRCHESSAKSAQDQPHLETVSGGLAERSVSHVSGQKVSFSRNLLSGQKRADMLNTLTLQKRKCYFQWSVGIVLAHTNPWLWHSLSFNRLHKYLFLCLFLTSLIVFKSDRLRATCFYMTALLEIHAVVLFTPRRGCYGHLKPQRRGLKVSPLLTRKQPTCGIYHRCHIFFVTFEGDFAGILSQLNFSTISKKIFAYSPISFLVCFK